MTATEIILWALLALVVLFIAPTFAMSLVIYTHLLVRTKPEKWARGCSDPDDEECQRMYDRGLDWAARLQDRKRDVSVTSDGFRLMGEYFDLGAEKAVIIIAGRTEGCPYGYYFAPPYEQAGYNVLVIDNRAHGLSDGKYACLGYREYRDIETWAKLLETLGNRTVVLHGICIGSSTALFALTDPECPACLKGMVAEGMYVNFYESFKNHMIKDHRPLFPFLWETMVWIRILSHANVVTDGPLKRMPRMEKPILFLQSREDEYSLPALAPRLAEACPAPGKLVWFDHGAHSRVRINDEEGYDRAIRDFLAEQNL